MSAACGRRSESEMDNERERCKRQCGSATIELALSAEITVFPWPPCAKGIEDERCLWQKKRIGNGPQKEVLQTAVQQHDH